MREDKFPAIIPLERCDTSDESKVRTFYLAAVDDLQGHAYSKRL